MDVEINCSKIQRVMWVRRPVVMSEYVGPGNVLWPEGFRAGL